MVTLNSFLPGHTAIKKHFWGILHSYPGEEAVPIIPSEGQADALLAQELSKLSAAEREKVYDDIHGVSSPLDEDENKITSLLNELEMELDCIHEKTSYELALALNRNYVCNRNFRLMFLRADAHDPKAAAKRIVAFFHQKLENFGAEKLVKDITLHDLTEDDLDCLRTGMMQKLRDKDVAGRTVLGVFPGLRKNLKRENVV